MQGKIVFLYLPELATGPPAVPWTNLGLRRSSCSLKFAASIWSASLNPFSLSFLKFWL